MRVRTIGSKFQEESQELSKMTILLNLVLGSRISVEIGAGFRSVRSRVKFFQAPTSLGIFNVSKIDLEGWFENELISHIDIVIAPVSYTHLTLPTIYSV